MKSLNRLSYQDSCFLPGTSVYDTGNGKRELHHFLKVSRISSWRLHPRTASSIMTACCYKYFYYHPPALISSPYLLLSPHCGKTITFPSCPEVILNQLLHQRHEADRFAIPNREECSSRRAMERINRTQKRALSLFNFTNLSFMHKALHAFGAALAWQRRTDVEL